MPSKRKTGTDISQIINSWDLNVFEYTNEELCDVIIHILSSCNLLFRFKVSDKVIRSFLNAVSGRYIAEQPYHNFQHGCDVCHTAYRLLQVSRLSVAFSDLEVYSMLVAALVHDVGHPGVNNAFLVNSKHQLAMTYNDRSPLENMHCAVFFEIVSSSESDILSGLNDEEWRGFRKITIATILGTDMAHHFEHIGKAQDFFSTHGSDSQAFSWGEKDDFCAIENDSNNRMFIMELVLHCADISHPFKPFSYSSQWAERAMEEFGAQGDAEKKLGLPVSPMCDRAALDLSAQQMDFVEGVITPLMTAFVLILPALNEIGEALCDNLQQWAQLHIDDITRASSQTAATSASAVNSIAEIRSSSGSSSSSSDRSAVVRHSGRRKAVGSNRLQQPQQLEERIRCVNDRMARYRERMQVITTLKPRSKKKRKSNDPSNSIGSNSSSSVCKNGTSSNKNSTRSSARASKTHS